jgi:hypothetical protein
MYGFLLLLLAETIERMLDLVGLRTLIAPPPTPVSRQVCSNV